MSRSKISRELKDAAIRRVRAGESRRAVAEELGLNLKTLGSWLRPGARPPAGAAVPSRDPFPPALVPVNDHRLADGDRPAPLSSFLRPELPAAALYGLPGRVATTLAEATGADPAMLLLDFLAMFGNAAGPQPHAWFGGAAHPARLFVLEAG